MSEFIKRQEANSDSAGGLTTQTEENLKMLSNRGILTGMSHEMRTHMNAIVAFSFLINNNENSIEEKKEFGSYIINSCEKLMLLFDNFLDSAIIDTGNSVNELRKCNLHELLNEQMSDFRTLLGKQEDKPIQLILDEKCINPGDVFIDSNKVSRVIRNLFQNALESTTNGYIRLGYEIRPGEAVFYILDSGQAYHQNSYLLESSMGRDGFNGNQFDTQAAVSLILARKLIDLMHGKIWVVKNGLTGTGVYFSIPLKKPVSRGKKSVTESDIRSRFAI